MKFGIIIRATALLVCRKGGAQIYVHDEIKTWEIKFIVIYT